MKDSQEKKAGGELHLSVNRKTKVGIYIIAIILVLIYLLPIYVLLNQSFREVTDLTPRLYLPAKWTLENYAEAIFNSDLINGFKNSAVYVMEVCLLEIVDDMMTREDMQVS